jgi:protein-tyrosine phosphatase
MEPSLARGFEDGIFWITQRIAIGRFATVERSRRLLELGVTHILNVGDTPSLAEVATAGFQSVANVPLLDLTRIPSEVALRCLDLIHEALSVPNSKLFLHCTAGQNRSPTILWLYLVASATPSEEAKQLIVARCPDAVPGHKSLVDPQLIEAARQHGLARGLGREVP